MLRDGIVCCGMELYVAGWYKIIVQNIKNINFVHFVSRNVQGPLEISDGNKIPNFRPNSTFPKKIRKIMIDQFCCWKSFCDHRNFFRQQLANFEAKFEKIIYSCLCVIFKAYHYWTISKLARVAYKMFITCLS